MTIEKKNFFTSIVLIFTLVLSSYSQNSYDFWSKGNNYKKTASEKLYRKSEPKKVEKFNLNYNNFQNELLNSKNKLGSKNASKVLAFPNEKGELEEFQVFEASIMQENLQERYKQLRSFKGVSVNNPAKTIRFSLTNLGLHAMILGGENGTVFIDPETRSKSDYMVYSRNQLPVIDQFECGFDEVNEGKTNQILENLQAKAENADDGNLRTYRLAIATTGEYSQFHLNRQGISDTATDEEKKAAVLSAIVTTMTRVNGIFERDVALTMVLVDNNTDAIFLDADTDGFTNNDSGELIDESQSIIDANIGKTNYDIGHTFSTGGGGLAQLNSPCTVHKAKGITGSSSPIGDSYDIDFVSHEMGHQYGAHHTFNSESGGCNGNRTASTSVEPGSGSTIMAYAGLCAPENIQNLSDDYFHQISIQEMWTNISEGNGSFCAELSSTGNSAPVLEDIPNYYVPKSTPLILDANATDADGDALTYTWEQLDVETTTVPLVSTSAVGPSFRSLKPTESSKRYLPSLTTVLNGELSNEWEVLPSVGRSMTFGVIVRDNNINGGQTASKNLTLTFDENSGPFKVTSQQTDETWSAGTAQTITWDVGNTNSSPINCNFVNILLSLDGGITYPQVLASNVANNGEFKLNIPNIVTSQGKVKVESVGNIFYAINDGIISIEESEFIMNFDDNSSIICEPSNAVYNFTYNLYNGFNEEVVFSASNLPSGATVLFNPASTSTNGTTVEMTISNIASNSVGSYDISVVGTSSGTSVSKTSVATLEVFSATILPPTLLSPLNEESNLLMPILLEWEKSENAISYFIEVSSEENFATTVISEGLVSNNYQLDNLSDGTTYYWRVKTINDCGESTYSEVSSFSTEFIDCVTEASSDIPKDIPDNSTTGVISSIQINNNLLITDVNVSLSINHPWIGDLTLSLISPKGTEVILVESRDDEGDNYTNTIFDDNADQTILSGSAPYTGSFKPQNSLTILNSEDSYGEWQLKAVDGGPSDIGSIINWSLDICGVSNEDYSFEIETIGETCPGEDNGIINISALYNSDFTATLNGTSTFSFTKDLSISDLAPGDYELCISIDGDDFEQCYKFSIEEGVEISGKSSITAGKMEFNIEQGSAPYFIFINGVEKITTHSKIFSVEVSHGDLIEVKTSKSCQGIMSKTVNLLDEINVYPNPTSGIVQINLPILNGNVEVLLFNAQSQLVKSSNSTISNGKTNLNIEALPSGIYFGKISIFNEIKTIKIVKQ